MNLNIDVLIVGAGPAGLTAAKTAAEAGAYVGIVDDNIAAGGQIWRQGLQKNSDARAGRLRDALSAAANVKTFQRARVIGVYGEKALRIETPDEALTVHYDRLILATGARERLLPFPGWTLPGVTGAGGLQALVKGGYPIAGKRVVVTGSGPLLLATASTLKRHGAIVQIIAEQTPPGRLAHFLTGLRMWPHKLLQAVQLRLQLLNVPYLANSYVLEARGTDRLQQVSLKTGKGLRLIDCDYLACGYGLLPNLELAQALGCQTVDGVVSVDRYQRSSVPHIFCAGEIAGIAGVDSALVQGRIAGLAATGKFKEAEQHMGERDGWLGFSRLLETTFALRPELQTLCRDDTIVCRCEDVCYGELKQYDNWRSAKLQTRCGMGPCQGRICGTATAHLFGWTQEGVRPPLVPARLESLAIQNEASSFAD